MKTGSQGKNKVEGGKGSRQLQEIGRKGEREGRRREEGRRLPLQWQEWREARWEGLGKGADLQDGCFPARRSDKSLGTPP